MALKKSILSGVLCLITIISAQSQSGISLYHMQGATFQGSHFNPSFIPDGKVFIGLPGISGIAFNYNNRWHYDHAITVNEMGQNELNPESIVSAARKRNMINFEADISTFYLGFRGKHAGVTFFVNERIGFTTFLPGELLELVWRGNEAVLGNQVDIGGIRADTKYYREMGIGFWRNLPNKKASVGIRFKYINGLFSGATDKGFEAKVLTQEDNFQLAFNTSNAVVNTSGMTLIEDGVSEDIQSHILSMSQNKGFGLDIGANWEVNEYLKAAIAINDLGFINWTVDPRNFSVQDTSFSYGGLELTDVDDLEKSLEDSLTERFNSEETTNSYKTSLNTRTYASLIFQPTERDKFISTIANHGVAGKLRMLYGLGYTRKVGRNFNFSVNVLKRSQQGVNLGIGAAVNLGAIQIYTASDHLLGVTDVTTLSSLDFRFGMNLIFGREKIEKDKRGGGKVSKEDRSDLQHNYNKGKNEKGPKRDGIYYIIKRRKPRPIYEKKKFREV